MEKIEKQFLKQIKSVKNKKIVFWGASVFLEEFLSKNPLEDFKILGIVDKSCSKQGQKIGKYQIFSPEMIYELKPDCIIIAIKNLSESQNQILVNEIKKEFPKVKLLNNIFINFNKTDLIVRYGFLIKLLDWIIPKQKNKCVFNSYPDFTDNSREYYEYLKENHKEYELVWIYQNKENSTCSYIDKKYYINSFKAIWNLLTARYIIYSHNFNFSYIFNGRLHRIIQLWHGFPIKTLGHVEKGINQFYLDYYKDMSRKAYFFVSSDIFKLSMIPCFLMNPNRIFITGQPRTDCILTDRNKNKIARYLTYEKYDKVIIYAPTYKENVRGNKRDINKQFKNIFYFDDYSESDFYQMLEEKNILFIIKPHPMDEKFYEKYMQQGGLNHPNIKFIFDKDMKANNFYFYDFFKFADLMITDFSSIGIDYLISKKPIIFLDSVEEDYIQNRGFILEDNHNILMPGAKVNNFKNLITEIQNAFSVDSYRTNRLNTLPLLHKYIDSNSSKRIFEIMKNL